MLPIHSLCYQYRTAYGSSLRHCSQVSTLPRLPRLPRPFVNLFLWCWCYHCRYYRSFMNNACWIWYAIWIQIYFASLFTNSKTHKIVTKTCWKKYWKHYIGHDKCQFQVGAQIVLTCQTGGPGDPSRCQLASFISSLERWHAPEGIGWFARTCSLTLTSRLF